MRFIILGGTGYLGKKLVKELAREGNDILCVRRSSAGAEPGPDSERVAFCGIDDMEALPPDAAFDCMINLSCRYVRGSVADYDIFEANYFAPLRVFLFALSRNVKRFFTAGTGLPAGLNDYTLSKAQFAETLRWYGEQRRQRNDPLTVCNIRMENFYGEDEPTDRFIPGAVGRMKRGERVLLTQGTQVRDFIYIDDVVSSMMKLIHSQELPEYSDIPLGSGEGVSIRELMEYLKAVLHSDSELCFGAVPSRPGEPDSVADPEVMKKYGIEIQYSWRDGMKKFI